MAFLDLTLPTWHCAKCNYYFTARPIERPSAYNEEDSLIDFLPQLMQLT